MNNQLIYQIALSHLKEIGVVSAKNLVSYCGSAENVFKAKKSLFEKTPNIGKVRAEAILQSRDEALKKAEAEIKFIEKNKIQALFYLDEKYPKRLLHCNDSPTMLYYKGNANLNAQKIISIVGTRKITDYGKAQCEKLIEGLSAYNPLIISGLAYGVDIAAHRAALKNNLDTVAVVANGMDKMYPAQHVKYLQQMTEQGGVLTEYGFGEIANKENFPQRNRIVAGMCDALILIETAIKGGAMITATLANSYNRDVFALPGRIGDTYSEGCNYLIKNNQAILFENADDILELLRWKTDDKKSMPKQATLFIELNNEEKIIAEILSKTNPANIDEIVIQSNFTNTKIAELLLQMEFKGLVKALPGKQFKWMNWN